VLTTVLRAPGRAKQEIVARVPPLRLLSDRRHQQRLREFEPRLPSLKPDHEALVTAVREHGAAVSTLDALRLPGSDRMRDGASALAAVVRERFRNDAETVGLPRGAVHERPDVWQWGLNEALLDVVERYLGLPARYLGATVRCERATGHAVGVRQWHRDVEDRRMLKILVWLNDVDADGGPFEYVHRRHTERLTTSLRYVSGFVSDEAVERLVPRDRWQQATGPTWTCVLADPANVFHRAMPPVLRDRYSLTFSYTTRWPRRVLPSSPVTRRQAELAVQGLNERQRSCLPPAVARRGGQARRTARRSPDPGSARLTRRADGGVPALP
jgi:hypothetical protein